MTKAELIAGMASESGLTKTDAEKALNAFLSQVEQALKQGEKVQLVGFGSFEVKERAEQLSYESTEVRVDFFNGEELDVKEIRCVIRRADGNPPGEGEPDQVKRKLAQVYNLPEGNINIKIQE